MIADWYRPTNWDFIDIMFNHSPFKEKWHFAFLKPVLSNMVVLNSSEPSTFKLMKVDLKIYFFHHTSHFYFLFSQSSHLLVYSPDAYSDWDCTGINSRAGHSVQIFHRLPFRVCVSRSCSQEMESDVRPRNLVRGCRCLNRGLSH